MRRSGVIDRAERLAGLGLAIQKDAVITVFGFLFDKRPPPTTLSSVLAVERRFIHPEPVGHPRRILVREPDVARRARATVTALGTGEPQSLGIPLAVV